MKKIGIVFAGLVLLAACTQARNQNDYLKTFEAAVSNYSYYSGLAEKGDVEAKKKADIFEKELGALVEEGIKIQDSLKDKEKEDFERRLMEISMKFFPEELSVDTNDSVPDTNAMKTR